ncbi:GlxA family transcriptional regulator [Marinobacterium arenosum]|uniref:GlxA family transcriptional regulator n=1 Tax=Marinobacterium arenosum TaxID=2862496 RepID=UPI001C952719|nr:GlxA family transcriptional regulator [Marinobacterium arenosum]MBY4677533.1 GlxA family transcriptional regulator [Marinobacterium arenosum]
MLDGTAQIEQVGYFLISDFSMLSFAAALEPLRMANRMSGRELYQWHFYTLDDQPVQASNGLPFSPTRPMEDVDNLDTLLVVAGIGAHQVGQQELFRWLRALVRKGINVGATSTGSLLLAKAGLLKNRTCTIHWENSDSLAEQFPDLNVTGELYEVDRNVMTCSGGLAGLDMMLHLIAMKHGEELAKDVAEQCIHPAIRPAHEKQRMELQLRHQTRHPRLLKALELMRSNIEEVLTCQQVGDRVGLSTRQLERLFHDSLGVSPASHYMNLRLERAKHLLLQSTLSVLQISTACGFSSTSYFARCYRKRYGRTPREERRSTTG